MAAVVATRDRPELLARCLDTLLPAAAAVDAEVIVVDSGPSSSDTAALVARSYPSVRYLRQPRPGLSLARNTGLHATEADVVAFTDDDVVVDPAWLARIRGVFDAEPRAVCVTGLIMAAELDTPAQLWLERLGGYAKGFTRERYDLLTHRRDDALYPFDLGRFGSGANIGVRRRDFVTLGGFDEALGRGTPARGGEDLDAFRRILKAGGLLVYEPGAIVWHYHRRMETGLRAAAVADGIGLGATLTKWALEDPIAVLGLLRRTPKVLLREWERRPAKVIAERSTRPPALGLSRTFGLVMGPAAYLRSRRLNPTASPSSTQPNRSSVQGEPSGMSTVAGRFGSGNRIVPTVSVVIPALNEARNLPYVFARLPEDIHEVVLVDGHSTDDTVAVARRLYPDVKIVTQDGRGKGNALQCGFRACTADIIVTLDADGSTDPAEIPRFIAALLTGADFAKGTRFVTGGGSADIDRLRRMGNRILSAMVNHLFGTRYSDLCYGYNAFWRTSLMALGIDCDGFEVETLMNIRGAKAGIHIIEVPSYEAIRLHGQSNLRVIRDGWRVLRTILRERVGA
jgi:glycosyltransferase involved in cell wall biosynthesis